MEVVETQKLGVKLLKPNWCRAVFHSDPFDELSLILWIPPLRRMIHKLPHQLRISSNGFLCSKSCRFFKVHVLTEIFDDWRNRRKIVWKVDKSEHFCLRQFPRKFSVFCGCLQPEKFFMAHVSLDFLPPTTDNEEIDLCKFWYCHLSKSWNL